MSGQPSWLTGGLRIFSCKANAGVATEAGETAPYIRRCKGLPTSHCRSNVQVAGAHLMVHACGGCSADRIGQRTLFCDMPVPDHLMGCFKKRADGQIMGLEMLSIALGARADPKCVTVFHGVHGRHQLFLAVYRTSKRCLLE